MSSRMCNEQAWKFCASFKPTFLPPLRFSSPYLSLLTNWWCNAGTRQHARNGGFKVNSVAILKSCNFFTEKP